MLAYNSVCVFVLQHATESCLTRHRGLCLEFHQSTREAATYMHGQVITQIYQVQDRAVQVPAVKSI